jgi:hypothetical protein
MNQNEQHPLRKAVVARLGGKTVFRFSEASRISGTSLPTFYTQRNLGLLGYLDENGKRVKSETGYTITIDQMIEHGWLKPEQFLAEQPAQEVSDEATKDMQELRAENEQLKAQLVEAAIRLRVREEDIERLNTKLVELEASR